MDHEKLENSNVRLLLSLKKLLNKESFALTAILIIILFYTLYFASSILLPIVLAILLAYLLSPLIRYFKRFYISPKISAILLISALLFGVVYLFYSLSGPAVEWINKSPEILSQVSTKISRLTKPLEKPLQKIGDLSDKLSTTDTKSSNTSNSNIMGIEKNRILGSIFTNTGEFLMQFTIMIMMLYFLLAYEDFLLIKIIKSVPRLKDKKNVLTITRETEYQIGIFLLQRTLLNGVLAIVMSILMYFLGMPNPILWGVMAGLLEFIPYLGVIVGTIIIGLVSIITFDNLWQIITIPVVFFTVCSIEGNIITPILQGRQFILSPVVVFLAVIFWGWLWGIIGAIIAVPIIIIIKTIYETLFTDSVVGEFLEE